MSLCLVMPIEPSYIIRPRCVLVPIRLCPCIIFSLNLFFCAYVPSVRRINIYQENEYGNIASRHLLATIVFAPRRKNGWTWDGRCFKHATMGGKQLPFSNFCMLRWVDKEVDLAILFQCVYARMSVRSRIWMWQIMTSCLFYVTFLFFILQIRLFISCDERAKVLSRFELPLNLVTIQQSCDGDTDLWLV